MWTIGELAVSRLLVDCLDACLDAFGRMFGRSTASSTVVVNWTSRSCAWATFVAPRAIPTYIVGDFSGFGRFCLPSSGSLSQLWAPYVAVGILAGMIRSVSSGGCWRGDVEQQ